MVTKYVDCFGYEWILDDNELINSIKKGNKVDDKFIQIAKEINKLIEIGEWKYVKNEKSAKDLLATSWGFHDAELININYKLKESMMIQVLFRFYLLDVGNVIYY